MLEKKLDTPFCKEGFFFMKLKTGNADLNSEPALFWILFDATTLCEGLQ